MAKPKGSASGMARKQNVTGSASGMSTKPDIATERGVGAQPGNKPTDKQRKRADTYTPKQFEATTKSFFDRAGRVYRERNAQQPGQAPGTPSTPPANTMTQEQESLFRRIISSVLTGYGISPTSITDYLKKANTDGMISDQPSEAEMMPLLYQQPDFRARFPSIAAQADAQAAGKYVPGGGKVWSPAEVIAYEQQFAELARSYGVKGYDPQQKTSELILKDISINEVDARMSMAAYAATSAPQEFRDEFLAHEGLDPGDLVGYFLDPEHAKPIIEKTVATAKMQAWQKQAGLGTDWTFSEKAVERGVTDNQAQAAFVRAAALRQAQSGYGETVSEQETKSGALGMNAEDAKKVERVVASRQGLFAQGGGAAEDRSGVSGLRQS